LFAAVHGGSVKVRGRRGAARPGRWSASPGNWRPGWRRGARSRRPDL